jgi:hypothetical protein
MERPLVDLVRILRYPPEGSDEDAVTRVVGGLLDARSMGIRAAEGEVVRVGEIPELIGLDDGGGHVSGQPPVETYRDDKQNRTQGCGLAAAVDLLTVAVPGPTRGLGVSVAPTGGVEHKGVVLD